MGKLLYRFQISIVFFSLRVYDRVVGRSRWDSSLWIAGFGFVVI